MNAAVKINAEVVSNSTAGTNLAKSGDHLLAEHCTTGSENKPCKNIGRTQAEIEKDKISPNSIQAFSWATFSSTEVEISIFKKVTLYGKFAIPSLEFLSGHPLPHPPRPRSEVETHRVDVLKVGGGVPVRQEVDLQNIILLVFLTPAPTSFLLAGKTSRLS